MSQFPVLPRAALILGVALSIAGCSGMLSGDPFEEEISDDGKTESLSYSLSRKLVTSLGGTDSNARQIEYKPRGPLTVPPAMELKQPEDASAAIEAANWPKQSDAAEDYIAELEKAKSHRERTRDDWENPVVPRGEIARHRMLGGGQLADPDDNDQSDAAPEMSAEAARKVSGDIDNLKAASADGAVRRKYLIDPPTTYRQPAGGAPLPSTVKIEKEKGKHDDWEKPAGF